jgi:hypothetical protein
VLEQNIQVVIFSVIFYLICQLNQKLHCILLFYILRPVYKFSSKLTDSIGIYASSKIGINTTTVKNQINIISVEYDVYGSIKEIAPIDKDLF